MTLVPLASLLAVAVAASVATAPGVAVGGPNDYRRTADISYDLGSPPSDPTRNQLDIYLPGEESATLRPIVVHVHGGGWRRGDKATASTPDKARLFTGLGYGFVSINYRLSPSSGDPSNPDPNRVMFPDHADDVGEAMGWLDRNAVRFGMDPDRIFLMGHSAGAHLVSLVSTDPHYLARYGVDLRQILGTIALDTGAFDIQQAVLGNDPDEPALLFVNAFGTPEENAISGSWRAASPLTWADPADPRHLFVVQQRPGRINRQLVMANRLGQSSESVVPVPLSHDGINRAVGSADDTTRTTSSIAAFIADRLADYVSPGVTITKRPAKVVRLGREKGSQRPKKRKVAFAFAGSGSATGFQCRLDGGGFRSCTSPRRYAAKRGTHTFRVRPLYPSGRPAAPEKATFEVVLKPRHVRSAS